MAKDTEDMEQAKGRELEELAIAEIREGGAKVEP